MSSSVVESIAKSSSSPVNVPQAEKALPKERLAKDGGADWKFIEHNLSQARLSWADSAEVKSSERAELYGGRMAKEVLSTPPRIPRSVVHYDDHLLPSKSFPLRMLMGSTLPSSSFSDSADVSPRSLGGSPIEVFAFSPDTKNIPQHRTSSNGSLRGPMAVPMASQHLRSAELVSPEDIPCVYFQTEGFCRNGESCRFSHVSGRPALCKFYKSARGCHFGDACRYSHETILCERVKVPESCLGALIGKNGTTRARLEAESRIENITIMTSSSEVVLTSRDGAGIARATKLIMEVVKECELRQQSKLAAAAMASVPKTPPLAKGEGESPIQSPDLEGRNRRLRSKRRPQSQSPPSPPVTSGSAGSSGGGVQNGWHQCSLCRKSFSTIGALTDHQRAKGHSPSPPPSVDAVTTSAASSNGGVPIHSPSSVGIHHQVPLASIQRNLSGLSLSQSSSLPLPTPSRGQSNSSEDNDDIDGHRLNGEMNSPSLSSLSDSDNGSDLDHLSSPRQPSYHHQSRSVFPFVQRTLFPTSSKDIWGGSPVPIHGGVF